MNARRWWPRSTEARHSGALLLGLLDRGLGLVRRFACCFTDRRDPRFVEHRVETLVGQRIFALALGYEDLNDHDELRKEPALAVLAGKLSPVLRSDCEALAGKSTLHRLGHTPKQDAAKYHKIDCDGAKVDALLVDLFIEAHVRPPRELVLDLDNTDIPLYGTQKGRFFHGLTIVTAICRFTSSVAATCCWRASGVPTLPGVPGRSRRWHASWRIRRHWPKVRIVLRADSSFANDKLTAWCEANRVDYVLGLARNARMERELAAELAEPERRHLASGAPVRVFRDFCYATLDSWSRERCVVAKAEHNK